MPHTRAARLAALKQAAEAREMLQMQNTDIDTGWNDHLDWDLPGLTYRADLLACFPIEGAAALQPPFVDDTQSATVDVSNSLPEASNNTISKTNFCGLQDWYSTGTQGLASISSVVETRPRLSGSNYTSYESTLLSEDSRPAEQAHSSQPWSPKTSRQLSSLGGGAFPPLLSHGPATNLTRELEGLQSPSSGDENEERDTARVNANKKRKTAHSIIEKNYRYRIMEGMAELRHCVPLSAKDSFSVDSKPSESQQAPEDVTPSRSSGKVATLTDAVQYVKLLELRNKALHRQLDVMQRRNDTLQKIALSKVDTNMPVTHMYMDETDEETASDYRPRSKVTDASKSSKMPSFSRTPGDPKHGVIVHRSAA